MHRTKAHGARATGILSAVLLCLTAALAVVYGPLADRTSFTSLSKPITGGAGAPDQHSAPVTQKRPFIASEWRAAKAAATQDDGNSKAALLPAESVIVEPGYQLPDDLHALRPEFLPATLGFDARAPPASS